MTRLLVCERVGHVPLLVLLAAGCQGTFVIGGAPAAQVGAPLTPDPTARPAPGGAAVAGVSVDVRVSFFGVPLQGADDVVFVLDRSGSMSGVAAGISGESVGMGQGESVSVPG